VEERFAKECGCLEAGFRQRATVVVMVACVLVQLGPEKIIHHGKDDMVEEIDDIYGGISLCEDVRSEKHPLEAVQGEMSHLRDQACTLPADSDE